jgi:hypothetical protein
MWRLGCAPFVECGVQPHLIGQHRQPAFYRVLDPVLHSVHVIDGPAHRLPNISAIVMVRLSPSNTEGLDAYCRRCFKRSLHLYKKPSPLHDRQLSCNSLFSLCYTIPKVYSVGPVSVSRNWIPTLSNSLALSFTSRCLQSQTFLLTRQAFKPMVSQMARSGRPSNSEICPSRTFGGSRSSLLVLDIQASIVGFGYLRGCKMSI